ncbi:hypothetical protein BDY19DRAFT_344731 [Irpex rosettiformis]|uniref:Uncharacterized protein n=1 Tax=Irpex rosettiformis TaxID=378272 RepID=A0ACB8TWR5_9APHY|nr:hypothetical protein BDY19DRAFT_344731 [Irpex rosettiformis]
MPSVNLTNGPESQLLTIPSAPRPLYPFLSHPPQKRRPTQPLPAIPSTSGRSPGGRPRSATISAISAWAAKVHPGSPAPYSPRRSPSLNFVSNRLSFSRRVSGSSGRVPSASFASFGERITANDQPIVTPSIDDFPPDLTAMGYTSVFVQFPVTPLSPPNNCHLSASVLATPRATPKSLTKQSKGGLKRLKSLASLGSSKGPRTRALSTPTVVETKLSADVKSSRQLQTGAVTKNKRSKYAKYRPTPLANDLALAQLMDGGKLDYHVKRYTESKAKANGALEVDGQIVGVGGIWRDEEGAVWMDQDEVWEFTHLLGGDDDFCLDEVEWVQFGSSAEGENKLVGVDHRGSLSTQDSDLSPRYVMQVDADSQDDIPGLDNSSAPVKPGITVLAIPARSRRAAPHLRKPEYLLDAFTFPTSPNPALDAPQGPRSPRSPCIFPVSSHKGKTRRRPPPLNLTPPTPALKHPHNPADAQQLRTEFLQDSFNPRPRRGRQGLRCAAQSPVKLGIPTTLPALAAEDTPPVGPRKILTAKSSIANMKGFLRAISGGKSKMT